MRISALFLAAAAFLAAAPAQPGGGGQTQTVRAEARTSTGTDRGAPWRIDVPAGWNGGLVILYHGYEVVGPRRREPWPKSGDTQVYLDRGWAVAASGYSRQGWAVEEALVETRRLRERFAATVGSPRRTVAVGWSMGGHLALATIEREPEAYDGALSFCGANTAASTIFGVALDAVSAFDALFPNILPMAPGGLVDPASPLQADPEAIEAALRGDEAKAAALARGLGIRREDLAGAIWLYHAVTREIVGRAGGLPRDNRRTDYRDYGVDPAAAETMRRYAATPRAMGYLARNATLTGAISDPVVLQSNVYDDIVPVRLNHIYPALVRTAGRGDLLQLLPPEGNGHCRFSGERIAAAFEALTRAVEARR